MPVTSVRGIQLEASRAQRSAHPMLVEVTRCWSAYLGTVETVWFQHTAYRNCSTHVSVATHRESGVWGPVVVEEKIKVIAPFSRLFSQQTLCHYKGLPKRLRAWRHEQTVALMKKGLRLYTDLSKLVEREGGVAQGHRDGLVSHQFLRWPCHEQRSRI